MTKKRVCYGCDKTNTNDSMWAVYCSDCWDKQRTWVGLTEDEANELWESTDSDWELMKRVEAKLKEKNT